MQSGRVGFAYSTIIDTVYSDQHCGSVKGCLTANCVVVQYGGTTSLLKPSQWFQDMLRMTGWPLKCWSFGGYHLTRNWGAIPKFWDPISSGYAVVDCHGAKSREWGNDLQSSIRLLPFCLFGLWNTTKIHWQIRKSFISYQLIFLAMWVKQCHKLSAITIFIDVWLPFPGKWVVYNIVLPTLFQLSTIINHH